MRPSLGLFVAFVFVGLFGAAVDHIYVTSRETGEVEIGTPPSAEPITMREPSDGAIVPTDDWPDACRLVTEDDVQSILPAAQEIDWAYRPVDTGSIREFAANPGWDESKHSLTGECVYQMRLPGERYQSTQLWVRIDAVADPALAKDYLESMVGEGEGDPRHSANCGTYEYARYDLVCVKGPLVFTVGGQTTVAFEGDYGPQPAVWRDKVSPQIARAVSAKIG
jgi:hypothetical protein